MIIRGIAASLGSNKISNDHVIDLIREHSTEYEGDLERGLRLIKKLMTRSGLVERRWCGEYESPIDHVSQAVNRALSESYLRPEHIDLLIYVGVGRGFLEPGNSHMMANALGFHNAQCFDVVDACMSWMRGLQMVDSFFKSGVYKNALIINAEFNMIENGTLFPANFSLKEEAQIYHTFPSFSIGEAATATLLLPKKPDNFDFNFTTRPDLAHLCTIPVQGYENFCHPDNSIGANGIGQFTSFGLGLHKEGSKYITKTYGKLKDRKNIDKVFVHASSEKEWESYGKSIGIANKIHHIYNHTGNLVSASIPAAMVDAIDNEQISRGEQLALWVGSAGMSFNATQFSF